VNKRRETERLALEIVTQVGKEGILQSELWKRLNATSREGSRIALRLERRRLIRRDRELSANRWTYRLYPVRQPLTIDSIIDCPCLTCETSQKCNEIDVVTPNQCDKLVEWVLGHKPQPSPEQLPST
ncbi:MAG: hypothetical protein QW057_10175, partial [Candidatus Bathyarchaeia archaeon]